MAAIESNDALFEQIMNSMSGDMKELDFLDQAIDYVRRNSDFLVRPTSGTKVKKLVNKHVATAKEDFDTKRREEPKNPVKTKTTETPEIEEIDMDALPKKKVEKVAAKEEKTVVEERPETTKVSLDSDDEDDGPKPVGNGGEGPGYVWTQTLEEVEIRIEVESHIRGKHLNVDLKNKTMSVGLKRAEPLVQGDWHKDITDSLWTLETEGKKKFMVISIEKLQGMCWWPCVIQGHPEINTKKIQPENSKLGDLDGETRQTVEKMMFDQRQKQMGKPTSKELSQQDKLKKFMTMHPEMDFSQAKFGGGADPGFGGLSN